jgi:hypothetical protein
MVTLDLFELKQQIIEAGEIAALGMVKIIYPAKDEVTYTEACEMVKDRRWIDFHESEGRLKSHRRGRAKNAKKYFSRMDIYALKKAETMQAQIKCRTVDVIN